MNKMLHKAVLRLAVLINIILMTAPFAVCWFEYYAKGIRNPFYMKGNLLVLFLFVLLYIAFSHTYDAFLISYNRISEMAYSQSLALLMSDGIIYIVICLLSLSMVNPLPGLLCLVVQVMLSVLWSVLVQKWYFAVNQPKRTAIVYDIRRGMEDLIHEYGLNKKFDIVATATVSDCIKGSLKMLNGVEAVFICGVHSHDRNIILKYCVANDIRVFVIPRVGDVVMSSAKKMHMFHLPMLMVERYNPSAEYLFL